MKHKNDTPLTRAIRRACNMTLTKKETRVRAAIGKATMAAYLAATGETGKTGKTGKIEDYNIADCITDLLHYAASRRGADPDEVLESACRHFNAERLDERTSAQWR